MSTSGNEKILADLGLRVVDGNLAIKPKPRGPGRRWVKGQSGNPSGRAKDVGQEKIEGMGVTAMRKGRSVLKNTIARALAGDTAAAKLVLDRCYPRTRLRVSLPEVHDAASALDALGVLLNAVGSGLVTAGEADKYSAVARRYISLTASREQAERLAALEKRVEQMGA